MASIRSFFAIPLSVRAERQLLNCRDRLQQRVEQGLLLDSLSPDSKVRWIPPANYHLTLAFLGDIRPSQVGLLHDLAREAVAQQPASDFQLQQLAWFPSGLKPRMLVAMPASSSALTDLHARLGRLLLQQGFRIEKRAFRPHITLARFKQLNATFDLAAEAIDIRCELDELVLFSSTMSGSGSRYTPLFVEPIGSL